MRAEHRQDITLRLVIFREGSELKKLAKFSFLLKF